MPIRPTTGRANVTLLAAATVLLASCSHSTGGRVTSGHESTSTIAAAPAPHAPVTTAPAPPASAEDQVKAAVTDFENAYNTQNWDAYRDLMCAAMRDQFTSSVMDSVKRDRAAKGPAAIESITVTINGDTATAALVGTTAAQSPENVNLPLARENGWKVCQVYHP